jgi:hypothetical protein
MTKEELIKEANKQSWYAFYCGCIVGLFIGIGLGVIL